MSTIPMPVQAIQESLLDRYAFVLRRLHSLTGLFFGFFVTFHLTVNASILLDVRGGTGYEFVVMKIHDMLGPFVMIASWTLLLAPIIFHAALGVLYTFSGKSNVLRYGYGANWRYLLQRVSGIILLAFIAFHVLTLKFGFSTVPFVVNSQSAIAASVAIGGPVAVSTESVTLALGGSLVALFYILGVAAAVFHTANGVWTFLITWGITIGETAQRRAGVFCAAYGIVLGVLGFATVLTFHTRGVSEVMTPQVIQELREKSHASVEFELAPAHDRA